MARYGEPDDALVHHARAVATEDYDLMATWAPVAASEFQDRGDALLAQRAEINMATAWLNLGRLDEADLELDRLLERFRQQGPPTFLNWALLLRGYSALFREDAEMADSCFSEGVEIELPPRTHTPSEPLKARAAFRRGEQNRAFRILRDHIDELLDSDNMQAAMMDCIEFVTMMAATGRNAEGAAVLGYLKGQPPAGCARVAAPGSRASEGPRGRVRARPVRRPGHPGVHARHAGGPPRAPGPPHLSPTVRRGCGWARRRRTGAPRLRT